MANIHHSISELVGRTPLVEFDNYEKELGLEAHLLGKLEYFNPSGSVKDRAALNMIVEAEKRGDLKPGDTILDFTSGNTGIATAAFANARGYKYAVVIQPGVSRERTLILNAYGVTLLQASDVPGFAEMLANGGLTMKKLKPIMEAYAKEHGYYYIDLGGHRRKSGLCGGAGRNRRYTGRIVQIFPGKKSGYQDHWCPAGRGVQKNTGASGS